MWHGWRSFYACSLRSNWAQWGQAACLPPYIVVGTALSQCACESWLFCLLCVLFHHRITGSSIYPLHHGSQLLPWSYRGLQRKEASRMWLQTTRHTATDGWWSWRSGQPGCCLFSGRRKGLQQEPVAVRMGHRLLWRHCLWPTQGQAVYRRQCCVCKETCPAAYEPAQPPSWHEGKHCRMFRYYYVSLLLLRLIVTPGLGRLYSTTWCFFLWSLLL